jgi:large subunit ribosomal protein L28
MYSESLGQSVRLKVSSHAIRTVEQKGGLDAFLLDTRDVDLEPDILRLKKKIKKNQVNA